METTIALVGNPNSGKTTLFNQLTGNHQYVGNWPGVTVERKTGHLKNDKNVQFVDLPGIYSLSPYSSEEVISRNYLIDGHPDVIVNIVDASNLERNLYLTTQLMEFDVPVVVALNQMDIVKKRGYTIKSKELSEQLQVPVVEISALKGDGLEDLVATTMKAAREGIVPQPVRFTPELEAALAKIEDKLPSVIPDNMRRYYAIKLFERDKEAIEELGAKVNCDEVIFEAESLFNDSSDAIITNERYRYIEGFIKRVHRRSISGATISEKVDSVLTNRILALPIFVVVITLIYYISISTVGTYATDWANDGVFGDGWYLDPVAIVSTEGTAQSALDAATEPYDEAQTAVNEYLTQAGEAGVNTDEIATFIGEEAEEGADLESPEFRAALAGFEQQAASSGFVAEYTSVDEESSMETDYFVYYGEAGEQQAIALADARNEEIAAEGREGSAEAVVYSFDGEATDEETGEVITQGVGVPAPEDPSAYGIWIPGIPVLIGTALEAVGCVGWLYDLIMDGHRCRCRRRTWLRPADHDPVLPAGHPRGMWLHGSRHLHPRPPLPSLRPVGQDLRAHDRRHRLRRAGHHGLAHDRVRKRSSPHGHDHDLHALFGQAAHHRPHRHGHLRRRVVGRPARVLHGHRGHHRLGHHPAQDQAVYGQGHSVCHGASRVPSAALRRFAAQHVGPRLGLHQEGGHHHPARHDRGLVPVRIRHLRGSVHVGWRGHDGLLVPRVLWQRLRVDLRTARLQQLGVRVHRHHRPHRQGERHLDHGRGVRRRSQRRVDQRLHGVARGDDRFRPARPRCGLRLHDLPAAVRAVLRGHGCHQARDGWLQQVVLGRHWLGVRICLRDFAHHLPDWRLGRHRYLQPWHHRRPRARRGAALGALPSGQQAHGTCAGGHDCEGGCIDETKRAGAVLSHCPGCVERLTPASGQAFF